VRSSTARDVAPAAIAPEVDRGAGGVDGTIQVPPAPTLANVRFVDQPGAVSWFQFPSASLVQFGCVALHPAPNAVVVCRKTSFHEQFFDIPIRKREPQIPADRTNNDLGFEVPPFEQRWPRFDHGISCSLPDPYTEFLQHSPKNSQKISAIVSELTDNYYGSGKLTMANGGRFVERAWFS